MREQRDEIDLATHEKFRAFRLMDIVNGRNTNRLVPIRKKNMPLRHIHFEFFLWEKSLCLFLQKVGLHTHSTANSSPEGDKSL